MHPTLKGKICWVALKEALVQQSIFARRQPQLCSISSSTISIINRSTRR
jgi:hypothetical protein